jgi:hypothetical protein
VDDLDSNDSDNEDNKEVVMVPSSWNRDFSTVVTLNDGHDSAWEEH